VDQCGRFRLAADMNYDGTFTISDCWEILKVIFYLPTNLISTALQAEQKFAEFFEITCATGSGGIATAFCVIFWIGVFGILASEA
jgi:hypothetical protein